MPKSFCLLIVITLYSCCGKLNTNILEENVESNLESPLCCNLTSSKQVEINYSTKIIENEYIVTFNGYYKNQARANYINTALNASGVIRWKILFRENPASDYPSDFDVVVIEGSEKATGEIILSKLFQN